MLGTTSSEEGHSVARECDRGVTNLARRHHPMRLEISRTHLFSFWHIALCGSVTRTRLFVALYLCFPFFCCTIRSLSLRASTVQRLQALYTSTHTICNWQVLRVDDSGQDTSFQRFPSWIFHSVVPVCRDCFGKCWHSCFHMDPASLGGM